MYDRKSPLQLSFGPRGDAVDAIIDIDIACERQSGLKALTFLELHDIFYRVFGDNTRQARRRLAKWRGADHHDKLKQYGHDYAWIEKLATGKRCYRATTFALKAVGLGREAAGRKLRGDPVRQYTHHCLASDTQKTPIAERVTEMFAEVFPQGGGLNELYYCLGTMGSKVKREAVAQYAWNMTRRGYLENVGHGVYRAKQPDPPKPAGSTAGPLDQTRGGLQCAA